MRFTGALHIPEPEVDIPVVAHRVEREAMVLAAKADRTNPLRPEPDLPRVEVEKFRGARDRDVDILDHRLRMKSEHALELSRQADARIPSHDLRVRARAEPLPSVDTANERVLRKNVLRAPEPVGVPAPDVIVDRQPVFGLLRDR